MVGPLRTNNSRQRKTGDGFARENFVIDFDRREVTCPNGQVCGNWNELPAMAPFTVVRFDKRQCGPCPEKSSCTSGAARTVNFLPQHLHELQARNRSDQQAPQWQRLYASRSGIQGTMNKLVNGHRMRRCRYHVVPKAHVQQVLTAIAVNIERLSTQEPEDSTYRPAHRRRSSSTSTRTTYPAPAGGAKGNDQEISRSPTVRMWEAPLEGLTRSPIDAPAVLTLNRRPAERCHYVYRLGDRDLIGA